MKTVTLQRIHTIDRRAQRKIIPKLVGKRYSTGIKTLIVLLNNNSIFVPKKKGSELEDEVDDEYEERRAPMTITEIANKIKAPRGTVATATDSLKKLGIIEKAGISGAGRTVAVYVIDESLAKECVKRFHRKIAYRIAKEVVPLWNTDVMKILQSKRFKELCRAYMLREGDALDLLKQCRSVDVSEDYDTGELSFRRIM